MRLRQVKAFPLMLWCTSVKIPRMIGLLDTLYMRILRPILFRMDAELSQKITLALLRYSKNLLPSAGRNDRSELSISRWGIEFSNPIGLAAGIDKNAHAAIGWQKLGFGFAELGTITPEPQAGNQKPRIWRLKESAAMVNKLGFPSEGCNSVLRRLRRLRQHPLEMKLGLNIGPGKNSADDGIISDYTGLLIKLGPFADFVVINLSSPNTPGLRKWQAPDRIVPLMKQLRSVGVIAAKQLPILIKLAPDLSVSALQEICAAATEQKIDGIVAANTTLQRQSIGVKCTFPGGVSGQPLRELARNTIRRVYEFTGGQIPIIGVGGIASAQDAYDHIRAGASLVEFCTGLIYQGPGLPLAVRSGLIGLLKQDGFRSIDEAVGTENQRSASRQSDVARVA